MIRFTSSTNHNVLILGGGQYAHTAHFLVLFVEDEFQITLLVLWSYH